jgi:hypothetical protein
MAYLGGEMLENPRTNRRRKMTALASARRRIQGLSPYLSLLLLSVPVLLVEPLKIVALFVAGKGHWLTGTGMIIGAYAVSLFVVERLFRVIKPKLLTLDWFAKGWAFYTALRAKIHTALSGLRWQARALPIPADVRNKGTPLGVRD